MHWSEPVATRAVAGVRPRPISKASAGAPKTSKTSCPTSTRRTDEPTLPIDATGQSLEHPLFHGVHQRFLIRLQREHVVRVLEEDDADRGMLLQRGEHL